MELLHGAPITSNVASPLISYKYFAYSLDATNQSAAANFLRGRIIAIPPRWEESTEVDIMASKMLIVGMHAYPIYLHMSQAIKLFYLNEILAWNRLQASQLFNMINTRNINRTRRLCVYEWEHSVLSGICGFCHLSKWRAIGHRLDLRPRRDVTVKMWLWRAGVLSDRFLFTTSITLEHHVTDQKYHTNQTINKYNYNKSRNTLITQ